MRGSKSLLLMVVLFNVASPICLGTVPKPVLTIPVNSLAVERDSIAFDAEFNQVPENTGRFEYICTATRPDVTIYSGQYISICEIDHEEGLIICAYSNTLKTTTDGVNFTLVAKTNTDPVFKDFRVPNDYITSVKVMADGSWIVCTGQKAPGNQGNLFRSTDKGLTWAHVFQFDSGYITQFGWCAIADNEVAVVEYGYLDQENNPSKVYYSSDYGATWSEIYDHNPSGQAGCHGHTLAFAPGDTSVLCVSFGDGSYSEVIKLEKIDQTWQKTATIADGFNPVCAFSDGTHLYFGHDGSGYDPIIWRLNPSDDIRHDILRWPEFRTDVNHPYRFTNPHGDVYSMFKHNGVLYAAVRDEQNMRLGGICVSTDAMHWIDAYRVTDVRGFSCVSGFLNGYLWGIYVDRYSLTYLCKMSPVSASLSRAIRLERGISNVLDVNDSDFEAGLGNWQIGAANDDIIITRSQDTAVQGNYSLRVQGADNGKGYGRVVSGYWKPDINDLIVASFWIRCTDSWPGNYSILAGMKAVGGSIDTEYCYIDPTTDWQRVALWGKSLTKVDDWTGGVQLYIKISDNNGGNFTDAVLYIDCAQAVCSGDLHYYGSWQPGGQDRADETASHTLTGIGREFTAAFEWQPQSSSREWNTDVGIASITDGINHIDVYYDRGESKFVATDGADTTVTSCTFTWEHTDFFRFAVTMPGDSLMLSIQSSLNAVEHVTEQSDTAFTSPAAITLGTNSSHSIYAAGLFGSINVWDVALTADDINSVFANIITGDFNGDKDVDVTDLGWFSDNWLKTCSPGPADCGGCDLNNNHIVEFGDFAIFADHWLEGTVGGD